MSGHGAHGCALRRAHSLSISAPGHAAFLSMGAVCFSLLGTKLRKAAATALRCLAGTVRHWDTVPCIKFRARATATVAPQVPLISFTSASATILFRPHINNITATGRAVLQPHVRVDPGAALQIGCGTGLSTERNPVAFPAWARVGEFEIGRGIGEFFGEGHAAPFRGVKARFARLRVPYVPISLRAWCGLMPRRPLIRSGVAPSERSRLTSSIVDWEKNVGLPAITRPQSYGRVRETLYEHPPLRHRCVVQPQQETIP
ncbi:MAG: SAM-dependent methyltransferase [Caudoviricetes sp.]|nr:MAG: SAM-dependent methyltransferase [Caudoviricetes sp.]